MNDNQKSESESDIFWTEYSPTPRIGEIIDHYKIVKKMVETNCSILMLSIDQRDGSDKVLKFVKYKKSHKDKYDSEVKIMKIFNHPNILKYEFSLFRPPYLIIALKYAPYGNLADFMNKYYKYGIPEGIVRQLMKQILSSVNCLHKHGIWHRDIKPQNFLVFEKQPNIKIKLADFGFAKQFRTNEKGKDFIGTPSFSAPEIHLRDVYTNAVDIWSIGITMYVLLVNRSPFNERIFRCPLSNQIIDGKLNLNSLRLSNISEEAIDIIRKMCRSNPYRRPSAEQLLKDDWIMANDEIKNNENDQKIEEKNKSDGLKNE